MYCWVQGGGATPARWEGTSEAQFGCADLRDAGPWARWYRRGDDLCVELDRFGTYPLFYAPVGNGLAIADSVAQLLTLGASPETDDDAIAVFLRIGFFVGEDTAFAGIRAVPAGGLRVSRGRVHLDSSVPDLGAPVALSRDAVVGEAVERMRAVIGKCMPADEAGTALPLSGGRDSRHIALELHRTGFRPGLVFSQHMALSQSDGDVPAARALCEHLGWTLQAVPFSDSPWHDELTKNARFDCLADEHAWFEPSTALLARDGVHTVFDGLAGDVLCKAKWQHEDWNDHWRTGNVDALISAFAAYGYGAHEWSLVRLLDRQALRRWSRKRAIARLSAAMRPWRAQPRGVERFLFWSRTRREIAPFLVRHAAPRRVLTPFLAPEFADFMFRVPESAFGGGDLHDDILRRGYPHAASVQFAGSEPPRAVGLHAHRMTRGMLDTGRHWARNPALNRRWLLPRVLAASASMGLAAQMLPHLRWIAWLVSLEALRRRASSVPGSMPSADQSPAAMNRSISSKACSGEKCSAA